MISTTSSRPLPPAAAQCCAALAGVRIPVSAGQLHEDMDVAVWLERHAFHGAGHGEAVLHDMEPGREVDPGQRVAALALARPQARQCPVPHNAAIQRDHEDDRDRADSSPPRPGRPAVPDTGHLPADRQDDTAAEPGPDGSSAAAVSAAIYPHPGVSCTLSAPPRAPRRRG
jgi:hypothetical protein